MGEFKFKGEPRSIDDFSNPDNDSRGLWRKEALVSTISKKSYKRVDPKTGNCFERHICAYREVGAKQLQRLFFRYLTGEGGLFCTHFVPLSSIIPIISIKKGAIGQKVCLVLGVTAGGALLFAKKVV